MQPQALIRTYVPIIVGALLTWLATTLGVAVDAETKGYLIAGFTGVATAAYYTLAHLLESRWPVFSVLLGSTAKPTYRTTVPSGSPTLAKSDPHEAPETLE